ncbi:MAG: hypothetical protein VX341_12965 [Bdellovibrionota bacterium]|nr:hypothetical protein [Bdellovibrionota bacterium]
MKINNSIKSLLIASTLIFLTSCKSEVNTSLETQSNKSEIEQLKKQLEDLKEKNNIEVDTTNSEEISSLKKEILALIHALEEKINSNVENLKIKINDIKINEDDLVNSYVSKEEYQLLVESLEKEYLKKRDLLIQNGRVVIDSEGIEELHTKIDILQDELKTFKYVTQKNFNKIDQSWTLRLKEELEKSKDSISEEVRKMIQGEVVRLKLSIEGLDKKILETNLRIDNLNDYSDSLTNAEVKEIVQRQLDIYELELNELKDRQYRAEKQIQNIQDTITDTNNNVESSELVKQIIGKLFKPCEEGLKEQKLCHTMGVLVNKFGGEFIDPTKFDKTKEGLVSYLSLSGVTSKAAIDNVEGYIKSTEASSFNKCFPGEKYIIAPQKYWPHLVINTFLFEKIAKVTEARKRAGLIPEIIETPNRFVAWYRNQCYQDEFFRRDITDTRKSDHLYGAALDVSFKSLNDLSFSYYNEFVAHEVFEEDIFDILTPLKLSGVKVQARHGHGIDGNKKFHLGILSQNIKGVDPYVIYNYKENESE